jgi:hypothetical protein
MAKGCSVAQNLLPAALRSAMEISGRNIWLSVWELNPRAIVFCTKSGFEDVGTTDFWMGSARLLDRVLVQGLNLSEDGNK